MLVRTLRRSKTGWLSRLFPVLLILMALHGVNAQPCKADPNEFAQLSESQLKLKHHELSLAGPFTLMISGGTTMLVSAPFVTASLLHQLDCKNSTCNRKSALIISSSTMVTGGILWASGLSWLIRRSESRKSIERELKRRRSNLQVLALPIRGGAYAMTSFRF